MRLELVKSDFRSDDERIVIDINDDDMTLRRRREQGGDFFCAKPGTFSFQDGTETFQDKNGPDAFRNETVPAATEPEKTGTVSFQPEKTIPDKLNLSVQNMVIFESGGMAIGGAKFSETKLQVIMSLEFAGSDGLSINDLEKSVERWADGVLEDTIRKTIDNINMELLDGKIPYKITSKWKDITEFGRTLTKKYYFFSCFRP